MRLGIPRARAGGLAAAALATMLTLPPGTASADPASATVTITATPARVVTGGTAAISGTVTEAGSPVPDTTVNVETSNAISGWATRQATTDAAGRWSLTVRVTVDVTADAGAADIPSNQASTTIAAVASAQLSLPASVPRPLLLDPARVSAAPAGYVSYALQVRQAGSATWRNEPDASGVWGAKAGTIYVRAVASGAGPGLVTAGASPPVEVTVRDGKAPGWLTELNRYRALNDAPPVAEDASLSHADALHVRYMSMTGDYSHAESPRSKWYTKLGAEAGESSDLFNGDPDPIQGWARAPYHALSELGRSATLAGYAQDISTYGYAALWVSASTSLLQPGGLYYQFPANGKTTSLLTYYGAEAPDPISGCPQAWRTREDNWQGIGLPLIFGDQHTVSKPAATLTSGGSPLRVCLVNVGSTVFVIPLLPLKTRRTYAVTVRYAGKLQSAWAFHTD